MAHFEDGTPYAYRPHDGQAALNVGWLSKDRNFARGEVLPGFVDAMLGVVRDNPINRTRGWHRCDLCEVADYPIIMEVDGQAIHLGDAEIRVTGRTGTLYAAPTLIAHYVADHS